MKKVGIFTIQDNDNYGNRLQNYAMQETLRKLGFESYSFVNYRRTNFRNRTCKIKILKCLVKIKAAFCNIKNKKRYRNFKRFNKNICYHRKEIDFSNYLKEFSRYDYIVVGSDQVWNRDMLRLSNVDLLENFSKNKSIAYAASFGMSTIPDGLNEYIVKNINEFKSVSVREFAGAEIIRRLVGKKVEVLVDPTMLMDASDWKKMANRPDDVNNKKYVLNYFLGTVNRTNKNKIEQLAKKKNWDIINILDKKSRFYNSGPAEFLWLVMNAELICTDSFHASVFAFLFDRPVLIFGREDHLMDMSSRLNTLIEKFKLQDRKFDGDITDKSLIHNYKNSYRILDSEREKGIDFLKIALGGDKHGK